jgi:aspartyl/glutamyl-tRNA(Asn/Gln) amidotransferase C subunit
VGALANLARLALADGELARLQTDLARILAAFERLAESQEVVAAPAEPVSTRARADRPLPSLAPDVLLASAPAHAEGFFLVPKTIGGEQ